MSIPARQRKHSIWKPMRSQSGVSIRPEEVLQINPFDDDSAIKRVAAIGMLSRPAKRLRTFTGQININSIGIPNAFSIKKKLLRIGISLFLIADFALICLFFKSLF